MHAQSTLWWVVIINILTLLTSSAYSKGPVCFDCRYEPNPYSCSKVKQCEEHQQCFSTYYINTDLSGTFWDTSCLTKSYCKSSGQMKRDVVIPYSKEAANSTHYTMIRRNYGNMPDNENNIVHFCSECCEGDYCNLLPCDHTQSNKPVPQGLTCFQCSNVVDPANCTTTTSCPLGHQCAVWTNSDGSTSMGCKEKLICESERDNILFGKRDQTHSIYSVVRPTYGVKNQSDDMIQDLVTRFKRKVSHAGCRACCSSNLCSAKYCSRYVSLPPDVSTVTTPPTTITTWTTRKTSTSTISTSTTLTPSTTTTTMPIITTSSPTTTTTITATTSKPPTPVSVALYPARVSIEEGDHVTFSCLIQGQPPIDVHIQLITSNVTTHQLRSCSEHVLNVPQIAVCELQDLQLSDTGHVQCSAINAHENSSASSTLQVQRSAKPLSVLIAPQDTDILSNGQAANITCQVDGKPLPYYRWLTSIFGAITEIKNSTNHKTYSTDSGTAVLEVTSYAPGDVDGHYLCQAQSGQDTVSLSFELSSITNITLISPPSDVTVSPSDSANVTLSCTFKSHPTSQVTWFAKTASNASVPLPPQDYSSSVNSDIIVSELIITPDPVSLADIQAFECKADNGYYTLSSSACIAVLSLPKITTLSQSFQQSRGTSLTLHCDADGNPTPRYSWLFKDKYNNPIILAGVVVEDSGRRLIVSALKESGTFTCLVKNFLGNDYVDFKVTVL